MHDCFLTWCIWGLLCCAGGRGISRQSSFLLVNKSIMAAGDLSLQQKLLNFGNDLLHLPFIEWLAFYVVWGFHLAAGPAYLVAFIAVAIWDVISGHMVWKYDKPEGRAVLVTGCDRGFGHDLVLALAEKGWKVYAGCLTDAGIKSLSDKFPTLIPVKLDVTKNDEIKAVLDKVDRENPQGLYALVNNAGRSSCAADG